MRLFLSLVLLLYSLNVQAQQYRFHQYRVEHGLPSDVIKAVTEDSLGFIWIATDDGLVKYDGIKFTTYKNAFRSQFAKGFLKTSDGRLYAFSDLDLIEIHNHVDTVTFHTVVRGERFQTDSTLSFPKSIYQDKGGAIWLGEPKSVVRIVKGKLHRYEFDEQDRSPVFVRSFSFFEDADGNFYCVSYKGNVFRYRKSDDKFTKLKMSLPDEVSQVLLVKNSLLAACRHGMFRSELSNSELGEPVNIFPVQGVSNLLLAPDSTVLVSTYGEDLYSVNLKKGLKWEDFYYNFNGINSCYVSREGDIWVATDKGLILVSRNVFTISDVNSQAQFIEGIALDEKSGTLYFATKETLVELKPAKNNEWERVELVNDPGHYFQSVAAGKNGLWATSSWKVMLFQNNKLAKTWDFSGDGNFVHDIFIDSRGDVWLTQAGASKIRSIGSDMKIREFKVEGLKKSEINHITEGNGGMYAVANGLSNYLYFKADTDSIFRNISVLPDFDVRGDFNVMHASVQGTRIWLASS